MQGGVQERMVGGQEWMVVDSRPWLSSRKVEGFRWVKSGCRWAALAFVGCRRPMLAYVGQMNTNI